MKRLLLTCFVFLICFAGSLIAENLPPYTSMVYPGVDGKLVYVPDEQGNIIPDYSYAGYCCGGVTLPYVPVRETVWPVEGDNAANIQEAINRVSELPLDNNGFRGAVLIKKGYYKLYEPIHITASGIVLRGEGMNGSGTTLIAMTTDELKTGNTFRSSALIVIDGQQKIEPDTGKSVRIVDEFVPFGAKSFRVESAKKLKVGDTVIVRRKTTREWFETLELDIDNDKWGRGEVAWSHDFDRVITGIDRNIITVDVPITCPIEARWGGGEVIPYTEYRISKVGVENLMGISEYDQTKRIDTATNIDRIPFYTDEYYNDENHYWTFIRMDNLTNGWVRNVTQKHFAMSLVSVESGCKWITVQDCVSLDPISMRSGGRRFIYHISGQLCLVQRCTSDLGRHSFVMGGRLTTGPNVFLDCTATRPYSTSEPHSDLVAGALYDNIHAPLSLRYAASTIQRWMAIWGVLWNCEGMYICQKPPVGQNFAFGHIGIHAVVFNTNLVDHRFPNGHIESWDKHVAPRSLYLKQLDDRLGSEAVRNIAVPSQLIDPSNEPWGGNAEGVLLR
ncbi:MAG: hypothetical protein JXB48_08985 [Candidatus Latescibacteria bacterium]|nr:hypothetical protein [Candidatus Latescibacterota bacterium]